MRKTFVMRLSGGFGRLSRTEVDDYGIGDELITKFNVCDHTQAPTESVAWNMKKNLQVELVVPENTPVVGFSYKPVGSTPP
ncbi:MAG: hypothetical protein JSS02_25975 [Planctomycetes bacterium]|nr:hypothetical protein [Planctomycetota bacterium]